MFIIWGSRHISKILATSNKQIKCLHCNNVVQLNFVKHVDWFTTYWIPIFPMHTEYRAECPICNYGLEIEKKRAKEIIANLKEKNNIC